MRSLTVRCIALLILVLTPVIASAQTSTITGTVKDASGGVLPGVTVEVSSPALIEKSRTAVTDGDGHLFDRGAASGRLHRHVRVAGLRHRRPRRYRADVRLHGDDQCRHEGRRRSRRRSRSPANRRSSTRRTSRSASS